MPLVWGNSLCFTFSRIWHL